MIEYAHETPSNVELYQVMDDGVMVRLSKPTRRLKTDETIRPLDPSQYLDVPLAVLMWLYGYLRSVAPIEPGWQELGIEHDGVIIDANSQYLTIRPADQSRGAAMTLKGFLEFGRWLTEHKLPESES